MRATRIDFDRFSKISLLFFICSLFFTVGCAREEPLVYSNSDEFIEELEAFFEGAEGTETEIADQKQKLLKDSNDLLQKFYGTPANPRLMIPELDPEVDLDEVKADEVNFKSELEPDHLKLGAEVFRKRCASCHGITGDGLGEAAEYLDPKPRDYRKGIFKFISTKRGGKPRRNDLVRLIKWGAKGTFKCLPFAGCHRKSLML